MSAKAKTLNRLFRDSLKDIYSAEKKIIVVMAKMSKAAQLPVLQAAFEKHRVKTQAQIDRLEKIFDMIEEPARGKKCPAINGLIEQSKEIMKGYKGAQAIDAGLLSTAQSVKHYEISRYGTLKTWARQLSLNDAVKMLDETLQEEKDIDGDLTKLAEMIVNKEAEEPAPSPYPSVPCAWIM